MFNCSEGWPRRAMISIVGTLAALGVFAVAVGTFIRPAVNTPLADLTSLAIGLFFLGAFASQWLALWLSSRTPTR